MEKALESNFINAAHVKLDILALELREKAFWAKVGFKPYSHSSV